MALWSLLVVLLLLNAFALVIFAWDKRAARLGRRRTPEAALLLLALAGGSLGAKLGQQWLRHKSSKRSFVWRLNVIIVLHVSVIITVIWAVWVR